MLGAIIGDIVGSRWEFNPTNNYDFEWLSDENNFTDDTIAYWNPTEAYSASPAGLPLSTSNHRFHPLPSYISALFLFWLPSNEGIDSLLVLLYVTCIAISICH